MKNLTLSVRALGLGSFLFLAQSVSALVTVENGIDVLVARNFSDLQGSRVGLITNHSGLTKKSERTIDVLFRSQELKLVRLFAPEHGLGGNQNRDDIDDSIDEKTGLEIVSLYGQSRAPTFDQLKDLDALVFDIQDAGMRYFTYISTMKLAMQSARNAGIKFVVLDRVNPLGGLRVEGPVDVDQESFVGIHSVAMQHGMTVGELAQMFRAESFPDLKLKVIQLNGWARNLFWDETDLPWVNPSPALKFMKRLHTYTSVAFFEFALSVGRGTDASFEMVGAPFIKGSRWLKQIKALDLKGVELELVRFTPTLGLFKDEACEGLRWKIVDPKSFNGPQVAIQLAYALYELYPDRFELQKFNVLMKHSSTIEGLRNSDSASKILENWQVERADFLSRRAKFLLYQ